MNHPNWDDLSHTQKRETFISAYNTGTFNRMSKKDLINMLMFIGTQIAAWTMCQKLVHECSQTNDIRNLTKCSGLPDLFEEYREDMCKSCQFFEVR